MSGHHTHASTGSPATAAVLLACAAALTLYLVGARRGRPWPVWRTVLWALGLVAAAAPLAGPLAESAHDDFRIHMIGHVLLGMLAPLLLVLAAPLTLALRALPVVQARTLARLLRTTPVVVLTHPVVAAVLTLGGLVLLYRTALYPVILDRPFLHLAVHAHVLLAGYLFTFSVAGPDPAPHRARLGVRAAVLVLAVAAHGILAKLLYADPPAGVAPDQAATAAQVMYYGGAPVEIALFVLLGREWYVRDSRNRTRRPPPARSFPGAGPDHRDRAVGPVQHGVADRAEQQPHRGAPAT